MIVDLVMLASARKHQVSDDDMLHAYCNAIRVFDLDGLTMLIGHDTATRMLEVSVGVFEAAGVEFIVHVMPARDRYLET